MAFTIDRVEAAKRLSVSTRTVDRHIQAGRIRTKRIGKKMFLDDADVESVRLMDPARREEDYIVIMDDEPSSDVQEYSQNLVNYGDNQVIAEFSRFYTETQALIAKKDEVIQDLSYRLGKTETELQNSIPLMEYKKATYLLESAKEKSDEDTKWLSDKVNMLEKEIIKRNSMILWLTILFILVLAFSVVFFLFTRGFRI
jgi:excisionase family DNA binding protein